MSERESLTGLTCPNCGGIVPIPEGQLVVRCPYCDLRSYVRGERGLRRYQVPPVVDRAKALTALRGFFSKNWAIARDATRRSVVSEAFLAYLPFWVVWGKALGWAFGQEKQGSGDHTRWVAKEVKLVQEVSWNGAACDVGEFGVDQVPLNIQALQPFQPDALHETGLVFEPVGSSSNAKASATADFEQRLRDRSKLDRFSQLFVRFFGQRFGLVYYPLWVLRYLYRGRVFQVVVDGCSGKVLYGKGPGNTIYRAAVLVLGMALGAFVAVDLSSLAFSLSGGRDSDNTVFFGLLLIAVGFGIMLAAYRLFRYGEQFEYRLGGGSSIVKDALKPGEMLTDVMDVEKWLKRFS
jgi:DNA-directed RNA polymerase subunit RPC12/RpoP